MRQRRYSTEAGFTLIEIAIVLVIFGLLLGGLLMPLSSQQELQRIRETEKRLDQAKDALYGYAIGNGALPCPDTNNDGVEDPPIGGGPCIAIEGNLPWSTLGTADGDDFGGNRIRYRVATSFINHTPISCALAGDINLCNTAAGGGVATCAANTQVALGVAAVILSHGRNGFGATNNSGVGNPLPVGPDEVENSNNNFKFVSRIPSEAVAGNGEFDDLVDFVPTTVLCSRMVQAGVLP